MGATVWARAATDLAAPDPDHLARLQRRRESALVTLTLATEAGQRLDRAGWVRLERLIADATRRLATEPDEGVAPAHRWEASFDDLRGLLRTARLASGLVAFVAPDGVEVVRLPRPPEDRVVVDPTFATRELTEALWSSPQILLLVLASDQARLFAAVGEEVHVVEEGAFPLTSGARLAAATTGSGRPRGRIATPAVQAFLRLVDDELALIRRGRPVVMFAAEPVASRFRALARNPLLGVIHGNRLTARPADLWALTEPWRGQHLEEVRRTQLERMETARSAWRGAMGLDEVWRAATEGRVDTLLVEPGFRCAGRVEGDVVRRVDDPAAPGVVDDLVDDLIEEVARRGGTVCFVEVDGLEGAGVAAVLRHGS